MRLHANGNLTIGGNLSDDGYKLDVRGNADITGFLNGTSANFSGSVGIGTNTPEGSGLTVASGGILVSLDPGANRKVLELYATSTGAKVSSSYVGASSYGNLELLTSGLARLTILDTGAATFSNVVGINRTPTSGYKLDIQGNEGIRIIDNDVLRSLIITPPNSGASATVSTASGQGISFQATNASGNLKFETAGFERMRITSAGNVLIGKIDSDIDTGDGLRVDSDGTLFACITNGESSYYIRDITNSAYRFRVSGTGTVFATNTTISSISDIRLKENVRDLESGLDKIMLLKPRLFDWKEGSGQTGKDIRGFIAQEVEEFFPEMIDEWGNENLQEDETPYKSVRMDVIPMIVKAIQELKTEIDSLKNQIK
jgi:hypothetical protein